MEGSCTVTAGTCLFVRRFPGGLTICLNFFFSQYWLWCPVVAPVVGAQLAAVFYDLFLNENGRFGDEEV